VSEVIAAVVPIKPFDSAKTRLGPTLDAARRATLAEVSADRVLRAVARCEAIQQRIAVVEDEATARFARQHYFEVLLRPELWGQSAAVDAGFDVARQQGAATLLTISADVPLTRPDDLERLLRLAGPVLAMVSDREGKGTNALRLSPAQPFRLHFGPDSLDKHRREAAAMGLSVRVVDDRRLRLDIDTADDIEALEKSGPEGRQVLIDAGQLHRDREKQLREAGERT
jgi:2-phospho-L-lactate guanylyltransferase